MALDVQRRSQVRGPRAAVWCRKCGGDWFRPGYKRGESPRSLYCDRCGIPITPEMVVRSGEEEEPGSAA